MKHRNAQEIRNKKNYTNKPQERQKDSNGSRNGLHNLLPTKHQNPNNSVCLPGPCQATCGWQSCISPLAMKSRCICFKTKEKRKTTTTVCRENKTGRNKPYHSNDPSTATKMSASIAPETGYVQESFQGGESVPTSWPQAEFPDENPLQKHDYHIHNCEC